MGSERRDSYLKAISQADTLIEHLVKYLFIDDLDNEHGWLRTIVNCWGNISRILKGDLNLLEEVRRYEVKECETFNIKSFINKKYNTFFFEKQSLSNATLKRAFEGILSTSFKDTKALREFLKDYINK